MINISPFSAKGPNYHKPTLVAIECVGSTGHVAFAQARYILLILNCSLKRDTSVTDWPRNVDNFNM